MLSSPFAGIAVVAAMGTRGGRPLSTGYLYFADPPVNRVITIEVPLPIKEMVLRHRTRDIRTRLRGDEVVDMDSFGANLAFLIRWTEG